MAGPAVAPPSKNDPAKATTPESDREKAQEIRSERKEAGDPILDTDQKIEKNLAEDRIENENKNVTDPKLKSPSLEAIYEASEQELLRERKSSESKASGNVNCDEENSNHSTKSSSDFSEMIKIRLGNLDMPVSPRMLDELIEKSKNGEGDMETLLSRYVMEEIQKAIKRKAAAMIDSCKLEEEFAKEIDNKVEEMSKKQNGVMKPAGERDYFVPHENQADEDHTVINDPKTEEEKKEEVCTEPVCEKVAKKIPITKVGVNMQKTKTNGTGTFENDNRRNMNEKGRFNNQGMTKNAGGQTAFTFLLLRVRTVKTCPGNLQRSVQGMSQEERRRLSWRRRRERWRPGASWSGSAEMGDGDDDWSFSVWAWADSDIDDGVGRRRRGQTAMAGLAASSFVFSKGEGGADQNVVVIGVDASRLSLNEIKISY
nr:hypothetical protein Iba_chr08bCG14000 [Ipomoea batatas]